MLKIPLTLRMMHKIPTARSHFKEAFSIISTVIDDEQFLDSVDLASSIIASTIEKGKKIMSCGNGGSMCDAMHFAEELSGKYRDDRPAYPAFALSDPSAMTCIGNDYGFENVFSRQIEALGKDFDILLAISTSGNSPNILKAAENKQAELLSENKEVELVTVGKKGTGYFNYRNFESVNEYEGVTDEPKFDDAFEVMKPVIEGYNEGEVSEVYILYTEYMSALTQKATVKQLLPVVSDSEENTEETEDTSGGYSFEPSPEEVLEDLIPKYMNATLFGALLNSSTSEHASRMRAMKAATENAEDLIKVLTRESNQARQAEITTEISEIVGGAEALAE